MFILTDERYSNDPQEFDTYEDMISAIRSTCELNGWEFAEGDEADLVFEEK